MTRTGYAVRHTFSDLIWAAALIRICHGNKEGITDAYLIIRETAAEKAQFFKMLPPRGEGVISQYYTRNPAGLQRIRR